MKITPTTLHSTPDGLRVGCVIEGPKKAWIRFAVLSVPWSMVPAVVMEDWARWLAHDRGSEMLDDELPF